MRMPRGRNTATRRGDIVTEKERSLAENFLSPAAKRS